MEIMPKFTITIAGGADAEGGVSTVTLDRSNDTWTATNDSEPKLLKHLSGTFKSGVNLYPGFATKGTALIIAGMSPIDRDSVEAFLYDYIPDESVQTGKAQMLQTASVGNWKRKD
jgi:hypothetical protein